MKKIEKDKNRAVEVKKKIALYMAEGICLILCAAGVIDYRNYKALEQGENERIERQAEQGQMYDNAKKYIAEQTGVSAENLTVLPIGYMRIHELENGDYEITMEQRGEEEIEAEFEEQFETDPEN